MLTCWADIQHGPGFDLVLLQQSNRVGRIQLDGDVNGKSAQVERPVHQHLRHRRYRWLSDATHCSLLFWRLIVCTEQRHRRRVLRVFGPGGSRSSSPSVIIITDRPSYTVIDCRRPSFSIRRRLCLERTTRPCRASTSPLWVFCCRLQT